MLLQDKALDLSLSISVTTRPRRSSEVDGVHYHFIGRHQFDLMKAAGDLLESAEVHGNCYGTPREPVMRMLADGRDVLFDIDWQGAQQVREALGSDVVSVFILPPSMAELRARLDRRAEDSAATIEKRLENAKREIERWRQYDYVIVNDDLQLRVRARVGDHRRRARALLTRSGRRRGVRRQAAWRLSRARQDKPDARIARGVLSALVSVVSVRRSERSPARQRAKTPRSLRPPSPRAESVTVCRTPTACGETVTIASRIAERAKLVASRNSWEGSMKATRIALALVGGLSVFVGLAVVASTPAEAWYCTRGARPALSVGAPTLILQLRER